MFTNLDAAKWLSTSCCLWWVNKTARLLASAGRESLPRGLTAPAQNKARITSNKLERYQVPVFFHFSDVDHNLRWSIRQIRTLLITHTYWYTYYLLIILSSAAWGCIVQFPKNMFDKTHAKFVPNPIRNGEILKFLWRLRLTCEACFIHVNVSVSTTTIFLE